MMQLARTDFRFPFERVANGSAVTIGSFDGLHLGHQQLLESLQTIAGREQLPAIVMSFEPMPREFFNADQPPARLMNFREKFIALSDLGIDVFFCPRFNSGTINLDAETFIRRILIHTLNVRHLIIGDDFRFGARRLGDAELLARAGRSLGFFVRQAESFELKGERVSSTAVRAALDSGDLSRAAELLGRPYRMSGRVVYGNKVGRTLGFPTANINLNRRQSPIDGIFAVRAFLPDGSSHDGVASLGTRPTFGENRPLLEVHVFDFGRDIYGQFVHVDFIARLRSEEKFDDVDALVAQMNRDSEEARAILATEK